MSLQSHLANEFADAESERLRQYQLEDVSLKIGLLNGYNEGFRAACEMAQRWDILKQRAPYEYEKPAGRPRRVA